MFDFCEDYYELVQNPSLQGLSSDVAALVHQLYPSVADINGSFYVDDSGPNLVLQVHGNGILDAGDELRLIATILNDPNFDNGVLTHAMVQQAWDANFCQLFNDMGYNAYAAIGSVLSAPQLLRIFAAFLMLGDGSFTVISDPTPPATGGEGEGEGQTQTPGLMTLPGGVELELANISAGSFTMGSPDNELDRDMIEGPQHQVTLTHDFWMGKYEVTKGQWIALMGTTPWRNLSGNVIEDLNSPVIYVTWDDVQDFLAALNAYTGYTFSLPTEAQWEYACRAGTTTRYYWGDDLTYTNVTSYAWYYNNSTANNESYAHVVAYKPANAFGLYDMSGNASEWCADMYAPYTADAVSDPLVLPVTNTPTTERVVRGGGWDDDGNRCRSAYRGHFTHGSKDDSLGFRLVHY